MLKKLFVHQIQLGILITIIIFMVADMDGMVYKDLETLQMF